MNAIPEAAPAAEDNALPGFNTLLEGPAGSGKTHAIGTLVDEGIEVFYLGLESGRESLQGYWRDKGKAVPSNLHWHMLSGATVSFMDMVDMAQKVNTLSLEGLAKIADPKRSSHNEFIKVLQALHDFKDDRTKQSFGDVSEWGTGRALVVDGLTGLNRAAMSLTVGGKPVRSQSDWQIAQNVLENLLRKLCDDCKCHFILLSHIDREVDPVLGGTKIMCSTLGKALAPKVPSMFSDVILTVREGAKWTWDTSNALADLKTRNLPITVGQTPSFKAIVEKWKSRGGVV